MQQIKKGKKLIVEITTNAFGGKGIAKIETEAGDYVIFVLNALAGQTVEAKIVKKKRRYAEAKLVRVLTRSEAEIEIPYQEIAGAPFARLPVDKQKEIKQSTALDLYKKIGGINTVVELFDQYIESPKIWHYRNKMEYAFSSIRWDFNELKEVDNDFALGFKHRGTWWCVENLDKDSGLFDEEFENKLHKIREYLSETGLPAWHPPKSEGFYRYLVVRKSYASGKLLINLVTSDTNIEQFDKKKYSDFVLDLFGNRIAGLLHTINNSIGDNAQSRFGDENILYGENKLTETLLGLEFEMHMQSFFQTNPKCAELLYKKTVDYCLENNPLEPENDVLMDLFCGTGTIGQIIAKETGAKVIGVDIVEEAIENAKNNALRNGINNVSFYASDVGKFLYQYPEYKNKIKTIVIDPPRAGVAKKTIHKIIDLNASRIVYVSCNPATQARDIALFKEAGYTLKKLSLVDQFPHTAHIEAIALFDKN
jgi:23S rRNA (uracil-5-)-methyltransferase RumA